MVGKNNTGKSNLLWAIYCFYHPKNLTIDDIIKDQGGNAIANELKILMIFDDLTEEEQRNNTKYYHNGKIKISLKGWIDENGKFKFEHHGNILSYNLIFPSDFDEDLKNLLTEDKVPKRDEINSFQEIMEIAREIKPSGRITKENWVQIKEGYLSKHQEIQSEQIEVESSEQYQGFAGTRKAKTTGELFFIPAMKNPNDALQTTKANSQVNQLVKLIIQEVESEVAKKNFQQFRENINIERQRKKKILEDKFKEELKEWKTTVNISLKDYEIDEVFPVRCELFLNDGVLTNLERKGTGLQRYVFFKFLKINNELRLEESTSIIILFEEPEAHLHPQIQREIASILKDLTSSTNMNYQTFISTHSPQFIDMENLDEVLIFHKDIKGCSETIRCSLKLSDLKEKIKTILFFDPNVSEIFFAEKIVILEGQSEEIASNFLIHRGNLDVNNVSIINTKSKDNIPTFLNIINELQIPYSVLIDEDPYFLPYFTNPDPSAISEKRRAYNKTSIISKLIDESYGHLIVISPDFDQFLGISQNQIKKDGKPTATYRKLVNNYDKDQELQDKVNSLFNLLINPQVLKHKVCNIDGKEWQYKPPNSVKIQKIHFQYIRNVISNVLKKWRYTFIKFSDEEQQELQDLISPIKVKINKKKKNIQQKEINKSSSPPLKTALKKRSLLDWIEKE